MEIPVERVKETIDFYDFCYYNKEVCQFCWTDWIKGKECRYKGKMFIQKDSVVLVLDP